MTDEVSILLEKIDGLMNRINNLEKEVDRLTNRLSKYETPKNSNRPPSSDFPKQLKTQSLREPSGKKRGGQLGHEGSTLRMVSNPSIIEQHLPFYCTCCGEDLSAQPGTFASKRQVIDIPRITPIVTEHQLFDKQCRCGHLNRATFPSGATAPVSYGQNVQALIAYLSTRQYIPVMRLSEFLSDMFGLSVSCGGIDYILHKMKRKASVVYESIRQDVLQNSVVGADETGVNSNSKNHWAWTFQHPRATFIAIHPARGFKAIDNIMPEGLHNNILVTDCWSPYFKTKAATHQLCTAHLLRELTFLKEKYKNDTWAIRMSSLITQALSMRGENNTTQANVTLIINSFTKLINEPINPKRKEVIVFQKRMIRYSDYVFNFLLNKDIPPDNNGSERAIRNFKVKLKISGFFKSLGGAVAYATIRSVIDTAIKNKQNPFDIIRLIAQCEVATE
jgi:transposase